MMSVMVDYTFKICF